jgi:hypothetical protein
VTARLDALLKDIRDTLDRIEIKDDEIDTAVAARNDLKAAVAELEGRVALIQGRPKSRNPHRAPLARRWNIGWDEERKRGS